MSKSIFDKTVFKFSLSCPTLLFRSNYYIIIFFFYPVLMNRRVCVNFCVKLSTKKLLKVSGAGLEIKFQDILLYATLQTNQFNKVLFPECIHYFFFILRTKHDTRYSIQIRVLIVRLCFRI